MARTILASLAIRMGRRRLAATSVGSRSTVVVIWFGPQSCGCTMSRPWYPDALGPCV